MLEVGRPKRRFGEVVKEDGVSEVNAEDRIGWRPLKSAAQRQRLMSLKK